MCRRIGDRFPEGGGMFLFSTVASPIWAPIPVSYPKRSKAYVWPFTSIKQMGFYPRGSICLYSVVLSLYKKFSPNSFMTTALSFAWYVHNFNCNAERLSLDVLRLFILFDYDDVQECNDSVARKRCIQTYRSRSSNYFLHTRIWSNLLQMNRYIQINTF